MKVHEFGRTLRSMSLTKVKTVLRTKSVQPASHDHDDPVAANISRATTTTKASTATSSSTTIVTTTTTATTATTATTTTADTDATASINGSSNNKAGAGDSAKLPEEKLQNQKQQQLLVLEVKQPLHLKDDCPIPTLKADDEVLVRIDYVGLNPIDWKSVAFGWGLPSLPCIQGRDYVGRVVQKKHKHGSETTAANDHNIEIGDLILGISTDYRDNRKAAFQEYAVASSSNVCRIPPQVSQSDHVVLPAIGVAFVSAALSLGISLGLDFGKAGDTNAGPDLLSIIRSVDRNCISEDIREECFDSMPQTERIQPGDWIAIWGASSTVGFLALQLAKRAGLKVVCIGNVVKHGAFLLDAGADALVNKNDPEAVEAVRGITQGKRLRYGFDAVGKETAQLLQATFSEDETSHLVCLVAQPKETVKHLRYHKLPMKLFHESPEVGRALMVWLEELLSHKPGLILPKTDVHHSTGLQAVNSALDRLRHGQYNGQRIVVQI